MAQVSGGESPAYEKQDTGLAHRLFRPGDDPAWKRYCLDESQWRPITVPGCWQTQGFDSPSGIG